jgi:hypothetical protein
LTAFSYMVSLLSMQMMFMCGELSFTDYRVSVKNSFNGSLFIWYS